MAQALHECAGGADRFVVVDVETTGVYPTDRVVEIALVTMSLDGHVVDIYETLVQPLRDVSATHIHGVTASMVAGAPTFEEIAGDVAVRLHGACLVAHNASFDVRMLAHEFERLNRSFIVTQRVDTLLGCGARLTQACVDFDITLDHPHCAAADALASAQLLVQLGVACGVGAPIVAPSGLQRSGRVRRREDDRPTVLADPPLVVYLASRLRHDGVEARSLQYLDVVGRAVADLRIDHDEQRELLAIAAELELSEAEIAQSHRRYVNDLIDAAISDNEVTDEEHDTLLRVATALGVDVSAVEMRIRPWRIDEGLRPLAAGMTVVFTGGDERFSREELQALAARIGLVPQAGVSRTTDLLVAADPNSNSGKAGKARRYGIPVMSMAEFVDAKIGDIVVVHGDGQAGRKVVICPDCKVSWTVPATSAAAGSSRCDACASVIAKASRARAPKAARGMWDPPVIEWLTCVTCGQHWHREVTRGRKPRQCPGCVGSPC